MNRLGMMIDITHASALSQAQSIQASNGPVVEAMCGRPGYPQADCLCGDCRTGRQGRRDGHPRRGQFHRQSLQGMGGREPGTAAALSAPLRNLVGYRPSFTHNADVDNWGAYIARFDQETRANWLAVFEPYVEDPVAATLVPTVGEWAEHVNYVIKLVGPDHVGIGLDMFGGRSGVPSDPTGYPDLVAALNRITTPENVQKITGENWLRVPSRDSARRAGPVPATAATRRDTAIATTVQAISKESSANPASRPRISVVGARRVLLVFRSPPSCGKQPRQG